MVRTHLATLAIASILVLLCGARVSAQSTVEECSAPALPIIGTLPPTVDIISVAQDFVVADVHVVVGITHPFAVLSIDVQAPDGSSTRLRDGGGRDVFAIYNDQGAPNGSQPPTCGCHLQPSPGMLDDLTGIGSSGEWEIVVEVLSGSFAGTLDEWCVHIFDEIPTAPPIYLNAWQDPATGIIEATWQNTGLYDAIEVTVDGAAIATLPGMAESFTSDPRPAGMGLCLEPSMASAPSVQACSTIEAPPLFVRGDCDSDGAFNGLVDGLMALNFRFVPGSLVPPCLAACDGNGDGAFNGLVDGLYLLNFQFTPGSSAPPAPYPNCGGSASSMTLGCNTPPLNCNP